MNNATNTHVTIQKTHGDYIYKGACKTGVFWKCTQHNDAGGTLTLNVPASWTLTRVRAYLSYQFDTSALENTYQMKRL